MIEEARKFLPPNGTLSLETEWHTRIKAGYSTDVLPDTFSVCYNEEVKDSQMNVIKACLFWTWNEHLEIHKADVCPWDFS